MSLRSQRRLAAEILGVGVNRVWMDSEKAEVIASAITREEIKNLIKDGIIGARPVKGISRGRLRIKSRKKRRRGPGSRKGKLSARSPPKQNWMKKVRAQRKFLKMLREKRIIDRKIYRIFYRRVKGGAYRSVAHLRETIRKYTEEMT